MQPQFARSVYDTVTVRRIFVSSVETSSLPLAKHSLGSLKWHGKGLSGVILH